MGAALFALAPMRPAQADPASAESRWRRTPASASHAPVSAAIVSRPLDVGAGAAQDSVRITRRVTRRTPLLPWPFYGGRSLRSLGSAGVLRLKPGSPEHRLLVQLEPSECAPRGESPGNTCFFLERGRVYAVTREAGVEPPRFQIRRIVVTRDRRYRGAGKWPASGVTLMRAAGAFGRNATEIVHHVIEKRDADRSFLLTVVERASRVPSSTASR